MYGEEFWARGPGSGAAAFPRDQRQLCEMEANHE
jgi:hypothetical protein